MCEYIYFAVYHSNSLKKCLATLPYVIALNIVVSVYCHRNEAQNHETHLDLLIHVVSSQRNLQPPSYTIAHYIC